MKRLICFFIVLTIGVSLPVFATATKLQSETKNMAITAARQASSEGATSDLLYQLRNTGSGALYGELLEIANDSAKEGIRNALKVGQDATVLAAKIKTIRNRIAVLSGATGDMLAVIDVTTKIAGEDLEGAAWSAGFAVLGKIATREAVYKAIGFASAAPINAAIVAAQIYKASLDAKASASMSRAMESFYGKVERLTRVRGRSLGDRPGPFPSSNENIDKIWQQIIKSSSFRANFGHYVVQDLQGEWPEAGYFASLDANYIGLTTNVKALKQVQIEGLRENKKQIELYISSMLAGINKPALSNEKRVLAVNALRSLKAHFAQYGASLEAGLAEMEKASKRLPDALRYSRRCDALIKSEISAKSLDGLSLILSTIKMYVSEVLRWLPAKGFDSTVDETFAALVSAYEQASRGKKLLSLELKQAIRSGDLLVEEVVDAKSIYEDYFKAEIKPFDWNQRGGPDAVVGEMSQALAAGRFWYQYDKETLIGKRVDYAGSILNAWQKENYFFACNGGSDATPVKEDTISAFYQKKSEKIRGIYKKRPDNIYEELWNSAYQMARAAINYQKQLTISQHRDVEGALGGMLSIYIGQAKKAYVRAKQIDNKFRSFGVRAFSHDFIQGYHPPDRFSRTAFDLIDDSDPLNINAVVAELDSISADFVAEVKSPINAIYANLEKIRYRAAREVEQCNIHKMPRLESAYAIISSMEISAREWDRTVKEAQVDYEDIRLFVDPHFMDDLKPYHERRAMVPGWVKKQFLKADQLDKKIKSYVDERESWISYSRLIGQNLREWTKTGVSRGVLVDFTYNNAPESFMISRFYKDGEPLRVESPYPHNLTKVERSRLVADLRTLWDRGGLKKFSKSYAPWLQRRVNAYFQDLERVGVMTVENFYACEETGGCSLPPITGQILTEAEAIVSAMTPGASNFLSQYNSLLKVVRLLISFPGQQHKEVFEKVSSASLQAPLAPRYVKMRELLHKKVRQDYVLVEEQVIKKNKERELLAKQRLPDFLEELKKRIQQGRSQVQSAESFSGRGEQLIQLLSKLEMVNEQLYAEPYPAAVSLAGSARDGQLRKQFNAVVSSIRTLSGDLMNLIQLLKNRESSDPSIIRSFYVEFQQAYEEKNESLLLSFLSDDWEAGDGTTLFDVEDYFHNMFNVFDEIQMSISGLTVEPLGDNRYRVSYDTLISSRIYADGLEHVEKSSVSEEIAITSSGKVIITRTPQGRFWYIK